MKLLLTLFFTLLFSSFFAWASFCPSKNFHVQLKCESPSQVLQTQSFQGLEFVEHEGIYSLQKQEQRSDEVVCSYAPNILENGITSQDTPINWRSTYATEESQPKHFYSLSAITQVFRTAENMDLTYQEIYPIYEPFLKVRFRVNDDGKLNYISKTFFNGLEYLETIQEEGSAEPILFTGIRRSFSKPPPELSHFIVTGINCKLDIIETSLTSL